MRLIDADVLLTEILHDIETSGCVNHERDMLDSIRYAPTIAAEPVRYGRWTMNSYRPDMIICNVCDRGFDVWKHEANDFRYCPHCGAKMDADALERAGKEREDE